MKKLPNTYLLPIPVVFDLCFTAPRGVVSYYQGSRASAVETKNKIKLKFNCLQILKRKNKNTENITIVI